MYATIWGQWTIISCTTRNAVDNSNFPSSRACKRTIITRQLYYSGNYGAPLPIRTILKYCVDCTQRSSRSPFNRNKRARNMENMSILPITLKLGLCNKRSNCTGVNEKGYWTPAFRPGLLSSTFTKSAFAPPQQIIVASPEMALNSRETRSIQLFVGETSLPQCNMGRHTKRLPSQKHRLNVRRCELTENSMEYAPSRAITDDTCVTNSTNRWCSNPWNSTIAWK